MIPEVCVWWRAPLFPDADAARAVAARAVETRERGIHKARCATYGLHFGLRRDDVATEM